MEPFIRNLKLLFFSLKHNKGDKKVSEARNFALKDDHKQEFVVIHRIVKKILIKYLFSQYNRANDVINDAMMASEHLKVL